MSPNTRPHQPEFSPGSVRTRTLREGFRSPLEDERIDNERWLHVRTNNHATRDRFTSHTHTYNRRHENAAGSRNAKDQHFMAKFQPR
jgi:hypothetical protein